MGRSIDDRINRLAERIMSMRLSLAGASCATLQKTLPALLKRRRAYLRLLEKRRRALNGRDPLEVFLESICPKKR